MLRRITRQRDSLRVTSLIYCLGVIVNEKPLNLYINLACLSVCLSVWVSVWVFVCLFVSNERQNGWTDRAQIFCGTSRDPREGLRMIEILNICLHQNSIFIKFLKILKIRELFLFCFTMYTKRTCSQLI